MKEVKNICICGGGALGHVVAGWVAAKSDLSVNVLSARADRWSSNLCINLPSDSVSQAKSSEGNSTSCASKTQTYNGGPSQNCLNANLNCVSSDPSVVIPSADVVVLCFPGYQIAKCLEQIKSFLKPQAYVGAIFSSTGFFFEAQRILNPTQPLWGFQRVPFIARVQEYGKSANLLGYKSSLSVAVENVSKEDKESFSEFLSTVFECQVNLLTNFYEASLTNSNPLLHTSRLYTMFSQQESFPSMIKFYEQWSVEAAQLLIDMDAELFRLLSKLPVSEGFLSPILEYYESHDAKSLCEKIRSISAFKGINSPMLELEDGSWTPDYGSRYFTEDFPYGLRYIVELAHNKGVRVPNMEKVLEWGLSKIA